jgi:ribonuclease Z
LHSREHGDRAAIGYHIAEETRLGRFNPEKAREMGIPEGPLWGKIHKGETVTLPDGRTIKPAELVGPSRPGRRIVLTGDSRPSEGIIAAASAPLIHEATFATEEAPALKRDTDRREAAEVAAAVKKHLPISARYSRDTSGLEREAREIFTRQSSPVTG